jgi:hypothetical protein
MRSAALTSLVTLGLCGSLPAQSKSDIHGWYKTEWGMSVGDIRKALEYQVEVLTDPGPPPDQAFGIREITVGAVPVKVTFGFDSEKLSSVALAVRDGFTRSVAFDSLRQSLIETYGKPTSEDTKSERSRGLGSLSITRTALWSFPSTSINLYWRDTGDFGYVLMTYRPVSKKPL